MKKVLSGLLMVLCFVAFSCSNLFDEKITGKGGITFTLPGNTAGARALENNHYEIWLNMGEIVVQHTVAPAGGTVSFEDLEPGIYSIHGYANVNDIVYEGGQDNIEVTAGKNTEVNVIFKIMDWCNPKVFNFEYDNDEPELNRYNSALNPKITPNFNPYSIVKFSVSGVISEDYNGRIYYNYGGWNESEQLWINLSDGIDINNNRKKGERFTDSGIMIIKNAVPENYIPMFHMDYSAKDYNAPLRVTDVEFKYEYLDEYPCEYVTTKSTEKGLEFTIKIPYSVRNFDSVAIVDVKNNLDYAIMESERTMVLYDPFIQKGEHGLYRFVGNIDGQWQDITFACKYTGEGTGYKADAALLNKMANSSIDIQPDGKIKLLGGLNSSDLSKFFNFQNQYYGLTGAFYAGGLWNDWTGGFTMEDNDIAQKFLGSTLSITELEYYYPNNVEELMEELKKKTSNYAVEMRMFVGCEAYPNQVFKLPGVTDVDCSVFDLKTTEETVSNLDDSITSE